MKSDIYLPDKRCGAQLLRNAEQRVYCSTSTCPFDVTERNSSGRGCELIDNDFGHSQYDMALQESEETCSSNSGLTIPSRC